MPDRKRRPSHTVDRNREQEEMVRQWQATDDEALPLVTLE
jgi:hypothetical protein